MPFRQVKEVHDTLVGFREGINEGTYQGKHLKNIVFGIEWLNSMINQSYSNLEVAKRQEKEAAKQAQEAIKNAGGIIKTTSGEPSNGNAPLPN